MSMTSGSTIERFTRELLVPDVGSKIEPLLFYFFPKEFELDAEANYRPSDILQSISVLKDEFIRLEALHILRKGKVEISADDQHAISHFKRFIHFFWLRGGTNYLLEKLHSLKEEFRGDYASESTIQWMIDMVNHTYQVALIERLKRTNKTKPVNETVLDTSEIMEVTHHQPGQLNSFLPHAPEPIQIIMDLIRKHTPLSRTEAEAFTAWLLDIRNHRVDLYEGVVQFLCREDEIDFLVEQAISATERSQALSYAQIQLLVGNDHYPILSRAPELLKTESAFPRLYDLVNTLIRFSSQPESSLDQPEKLFSELNACLEVIRAKDPDLYFFVCWSLLPCIETISNLCKSEQYQSIESLLIELLLFVTDDENFPNELNLDKSNPAVKKAIEDAITIWKAGLNSKHKSHIQDATENNFNFKEFGLSDLLKDIKSFDNLSKRIETATDFFVSFLELLNRYNETEPIYVVRRKVLLKSINRTIRRIANLFMIGNTTGNLNPYDDEAAIFEKRLQLILRLHVATEVIKLNEHLQSNAVNLVNLRSIIEGRELANLLNSSQRLIRMYGMTSEI